MKREEEGEENWVEEGSARANVSLSSLTCIVAAVLLRAYKTSRAPSTAACQHMVAGIKDPAVGRH